MKRQKRIIVLLVALVAVCAATFGISRYQQAQEEIRESGETIISINTEDVNALSWTNDQGDFSFTKDVDTDEWTYDDDDAFPVSTEKIEDMLSIFNDFGAAFQIDNVTDFAQYGLDEPIATIYIDTDNESYEISLGDYSQIDEERYVSLGGSSAYLAVHDPLDEFGVTSDDLIDDDTIPDFDDDSLDAMYVTTDTEDYYLFYVDDSPLSYDRNDVYYADVEDDTKPLSQDKVESYLDALKDLDLTNFVKYDATDEDLADYGLDDPDLRLEVSYNIPEDEQVEDSEGNIAITGAFALSIARDPEEAAAARQEEQASANDASGDGTTEEGASDTDGSAGGSVSAGGSSGDTIGDSASGGDGAGDSDVATSSDEEEITAYARYGNSPIIYQISKDEYETLLKAGYNDLRHDEVMTAEERYIPEIDITLEGSTYILTSETTGVGESEETIWSMNGEEIDASDLLDAIRSAAATEFTDDAPTGEEEISLTVSAMPDEDNIDEVDISFYRYDGSSCLAVINDEPFGYVPRSQVVDIIEATHAIVLN